MGWLRLVALGAVALVLAGRLTSPPVGQVAPPTWFWAWLALIGLVAVGWVAARPSPVAFAVVAAVTSTLFAARAVEYLVAQWGNWQLLTGPAITSNVGLAILTPVLVLLLMGLR